MGGPTGPGVGLVSAKVTAAAAVSVQHASVRSAAFATAGETRVTPDRVDAVFACVSLGQTQATENPIVVNCSSDLPNVL